MKVHCAKSPTPQTMTSSAITSSSSGSESDAANSSIDENGATNGEMKDEKLSRMTPSGGDNRNSDASAAVGSLASRFSSTAGSRLQSAATGNC